MIRKKGLSIMLVLAVAFCFMPFNTMNAEAASTGSTVLAKTKTVTIKPGKTYNTPKVSISEKMAFQVPMEVWLSPKDKGKPKYYIKKGGFKISLKTAKGKNKSTVNQSLKGVDKHEDCWYHNWIYYYDGDDLSDPGFEKGKYYFSIKNTTGRTIKVKYSVRGYTEIASTAEFPEEVDWSEGADWDLGVVGPGIPIVEPKSFEFDDPLFGIDMWNISADGELWLVPYGDFPENEVRTATLSVKLKNRVEPYKIRMTIRGDLEVEDEDEDDYDYEDESEDWDK